MTMDIIYLLVGFVLLVGGGELLVRGAVRIASRLGLSPLLIGLTVVGFGTSSPELAASVQAALAGSPGLALGNIVGSNLANLMLILGATALITPFIVARGVLWRDGGVGLLAAIVLLVAGLTLGLDRIVGTVLIICMAAYIVYAFRQENLGQAHTAAYDKAAAAVELDPAFAPGAADSGPLGTAIVLFLIGLALIVGGGSLLVTGAINIAASLGVADEVIGLTVVAIGTSLPELVTSVIAALKREGDIALGNVLGSNIYNILLIGGVTGVVAPSQIPASILGFDLWLLIAVSVLVMIFAFTGGRLSRKEGGVLLVGYIAYMLWTAGVV